MSAPTESRRATAEPEQDNGSGLDFDAASAQRAAEYCYEKSWTDGLPVVPCTESLLKRFLEQVDRDPSEVVLSMPHLNRSCTVQLAAINAAMAGCRPEYFPVVLAAWDALRDEGYAGKGVFQSTTGAAPLLVVNGPVRERLQINCKGNVFGPGFRANATIGRAIRLTAINAFGLQPQVLDQSTQATPAKYTLCIGENEEETPWEPLHVDVGYRHDDSTLTAIMMRSVMHIEARHTILPDQLINDLSDTVVRTGALIHETTSACLVLNPEHAKLLAGGGLSKRDVQEAVFGRAVADRALLESVGKAAVARSTRWRVPGDHPEAELDGQSNQVRVLKSPDSVTVVVAGASNAGVSAVVETFGPRADPPAIARVRNT